MKRLVLLLFALVLVIDLADDGCHGKVRCVSPHSSIKVSVASPHLGGAGKLDSPGALPPADWRGPPGQGLRQPVTSAVQQILKRIDCCQPGSTGGLLLKRAFHSPFIFFGRQASLSDKSTAIGFGYCHLVAGPNRGDAVLIYREKLQIPLNPPFSKGYFDSNSL